FFFFQAEDGIRDKLVTGVQTCALPILNTSGYRGQIPSFQSLLMAGSDGQPVSGWSRLVNQFSVVNGTRLDLGQGNLEHTANPLRSEERRVGKECSSRGGRCDDKKKTEK